METSDEPTTANDRAARSQRGFLRLDLVIATIALVASISASVASVIQTKTLGDQFSASVWPYVVINYDFDASAKTIKAQIRNEGLGPALIRTAEITLDGRPQRSLLAIVDRLAPDARHRDVGNSDFGGGIVIRASDTFTFFDVHTPDYNIDRIAKAVDAIATHVCYCSLLGNCWTTSTNATEPTPVARCGPPTRKITLSMRDLLRR